MNEITKRLSAMQVKEGDVILYKDRKLTILSIDIQVAPLTHPVKHSVTIDYKDENGSRNYLICSGNYPLEVVMETEE